MAYAYAFDPTGTLTANRIVGEQQVLTYINGRNYHLLVPKAAPYFADSLTLTYRAVDGTITPLVEGIDYHHCYQFIGASRGCARPIYGAISFIDLQLAGSVTLTYQTLGGEWTIDTGAVDALLSDTLRNPRTVSWEQITNLPVVFPPVDHPWNLDDMVGLNEIMSVLGNIANAIAARQPAQPLKDIELYPTKSQVGLGYVSNFRMASDSEAMDGVLSTRYMSPRSVAVVATDLERRMIDRFESTLSSNTCPVSGSWNAKQFVTNTRPLITQWPANHPLYGLSYIVNGWKRITDGSSNTPGLDWVEDRIIIG